MMETSVRKIMNEAMPVMRAIAANMVKDGIAQQFVYLPESDRIELTKAYYADQIRKNEQLQTMYMTNPEFKDHFTRMVLASLT